MEEKKKRFSISLTPELSARLQKVKAEFYPQLSDGKMLEALIRMGLDALPIDENDRDKRTDSDQISREVRCRIGGKK